MIKHVWTVLCQKSIVDKETNNLSLDVLEQLKIKIPEISEKDKGVIFPFQMEIVSMWARDPAEKGFAAKGHLSIQAPNGEVVNETDFPIDLEKSQRHRTRIRLDGLPIPKGASGIFNFCVTLTSMDNSIEVAKIPLEVTVETFKP